MKGKVGSYRQYVIAVIWRLCEFDRFLCQTPRKDVNKKYSRHTLGE